MQALVYSVEPCLDAILYPQLASTLEKPKGSPSQILELETYPGGSSLLTAGRLGNRTALSL